MRVLNTQTSPADDFRLLTPVVENDIEPMSPFLRRTRQRVALPDPANSSARPLEVRLVAAWHMQPSNGGDATEIEAVVVGTDELLRKVPMFDNKSQAPNGELC